MPDWVFAATRQKTKSGERNGEERAPALVGKKISDFGEEAGFLILGGAAGKSVRRGGFGGASGGAWVTGKQSTGAKVRSQNSLSRGNNYCYLPTFC